MTASPETLAVGVLQAAYGEDMAANIALTADLVRQAADQGAQVILPSELFQGPYFCTTQDERWFATAHPWREHPCVTAMAALAAELDVAIPVSIFEREGPHYFNSLVMLDGAAPPLGVYRKSHIPDGPGYQEKYYFRPGDTGFKVWSTRFGHIGTGNLLGPVVSRGRPRHDPDGGRRAALPHRHRIGAPRRQPGHPRSLAAGDAGPRGANVIPVAASNRVGHETAGGSADGQSFYGSSFIADHRGDLLADMDRTETGVAVARFDRAFLRTHRAAWGFFRDRRTDLYEAVGPRRAFESAP